MNVKSKVDYVFGDEQWLVKGNTYTVNEVVKMQIGPDAYVIDGQVFGASLFEVIDDNICCGGCNHD